MMRPIEIKTTGTLLDELFTAVQKAYHAPSDEMRQAAELRCARLAEALDGRCVPGYGSQVMFLARLYQEQVHKPSGMGSAAYAAAVAEYQELWANRAVTAAMTGLLQASDACWHTQEQCQDLRLGVEARAAAAAASMRANRERCECMRWLDREFGEDTGVLAKVGYAEVTP